MHQQARALVVGLAVAVAGAAGTWARPGASSSPFAYGRGQALVRPGTGPGAVDRGRVNRDYPVAVHDVSYVSGTRRVPAYLAVPPRAGRRAAVVYVHGSGGDREQMLVPAVWLSWLTRRLGIGPVVRGTRTGP